MSPDPKLKIESFAKATFKGALGIMAEIALISFIIVVGLAASFVWWGLFR